MASVLLGTIVITTPITIPWFYLKHFDQLEDEEFEEKWGATYEGLSEKNKWSLVYPVSFVLRRLAFAIIAFWGSGFVVGQLTA